jgi:pyrimidine operon attenuation protein/uracil phosphoribosyltransferase
MSPRIQIVQRIEDEVEFLEPYNVELAILDVGVFRFDVDAGVESSGRLFRNLAPCQRKLYHLFPGV